MIAGNNNLYTIKYLGTNFFNYGKLWEIVRASFGSCCCSFPKPLNTRGPSVVSQGRQPFLTLRTFTAKLWCSKSNNHRLKEAFPACAAPELIAAFCWKSPHSNERKTASLYHFNLCNLFHKAMELWGRRGMGKIRGSRGSPLVSGQWFNLIGPKDPLDETDSIRKGLQLEGQ